VGFGEGEDGMQLDAVGRDPALAWGLSKKPTPLSVARPLNLCASCAPVRTATWRIQAVLSGDARLVPEHYEKADTPLNNRGSA
jgi:hypothetical protein